MKPDDIREDAILEIARWVGDRERSHRNREFTHETEIRASECGYAGAMTVGMRNALDYRDRREVTDPAEIAEIRDAALEDAASFLAKRRDEMAEKIANGATDPARIFRHSECGAIVAAITGFRNSATPAPEEEPEDEPSMGPRL